MNAWRVSSSCCVPVFQFKEHDNVGMRTCAAWFCEKWKNGSWNPSLNLFNKTNDDKFPASYERPVATCSCTFVKILISSLDGLFMFFDEMLCVLVCSTLNSSSFFFPLLLSPSHSFSLTRLGRWWSSSTPEEDSLSCCLQHMRWVDEKKKCEDLMLRLWRSFRDREKRFFQVFGDIFSSPLTLYLKWNEEAVKWKAKSTMMSRMSEVWLQESHHMSIEAGEAAWLDKVFPSLCFVRISKDFYRLRRSPTWVDLTCWNNSFCFRSQRESEWSLSSCCCC